MATKVQRRRLGLLFKAQKHHDYVRAIRSVKRADEISGHVVDVGRRWVLLAVSSDGSPNGYVALQVADISGLFWALGGKFIRRSLKAQAAWPPPAPSQQIDLDHGVQRLVDAAAAMFPLVTLHPELDSPKVCYPGRPVRWGRRKVHWQEVDPQGRWELTPTKHRIDQITRVDFGGVYETNLAAVAGPQPPLN